MLEYDPQKRSLSTNAYTAAFADTDRALHVQFAGGAAQTFALAGAAHTWDVLDQDRERRCEVRREAGAVVARIRSDSTAWTRKTLVLTFRPDDVLVHLELEGEGTLEEVCLFAGLDAGAEAYPGPACFHRRRPPAWREGYRGSPVQCERVFCPAANQFGRQRTPPCEPLYVGVAENGHPDQPRPNRLAFPATPGPWLYALESDAGAVGLGLVAPVKRQTFTHFRYAGGSRWGLVLDYNGHTAVDGAWRSPQVRIFPAGSGEQAVSLYAEGLRDEGHVPAPRRDRDVSWWREPIFCPWGQQLAYARQSGQPHRIYCTEANYERYLAHLAAHGVCPGTIVLEFMWNRRLGEPAGDPGKWPDVRAFVERCHGRGQRVLLWFGTWCEWKPVSYLNVPVTPLPVEAAVLDPAGRPVDLDAATPAGERVVREFVRACLSDAPACLNADGFKVDLAHFSPYGRELRSDGGLWGAALLHRLLSVVHGEARAVKPDCLLTGQAVNPYFEPVLDLYRSNDTDNDLPDVTPQLRFRHEMAQRVYGGRVEVDFESAPLTSLEQWRRVMRLAPELGVPDLYHVTHVCGSGEAIPPEDLRALGALWEEYRRRRGLPARGGGAAG